MRRINCGPLAIAVIAFCVLLGRQPALSSDDVLTVGTEGGWKPYSYMDAAGNLVGFEVELIRAVCEKSGLACEVIVVPWESLIPALQEGKIDAIASGMRPTPKRLKVVDFSIPWYKATPSFATCKHKGLAENSPEALKAMTVGVQSGSNHQDFLMARYPGLEIVTYKKIDDIYADLHSGRLDIAYGGKPTIHDFLQTEKGKDCAFVGAEINDAEFYSVANAIAMRKGDTATKEKLDRGVKMILEDGTFDKINVKYWPFSLRYNPSAD